MNDVVIIGAGPAGLTAATYLGRFLRPTIVIDGGASRARWIPKSHNMPGFPQGIGGLELLSQLQAQAVRYGAQIKQGQVQCLMRVDNAFEVHLETESLQSRYVLLATGVRDRLPELDGTAEAVLRSVVRVCPICDAFEATGKRIAVISDNERGVREAEFLTTYSDSVTVIDVRNAIDNNGHARQFETPGIRVIPVAWNQLELKGTALRLHSAGGTITFDVVYSALGCTPLDKLATDLGAKRDGGNALIVDPHQQTSVPRLYAAGDTVRGLNQIVVAAAEAAIAATDIHNRLRKN